MLYEKKGNAKGRSVKVFALVLALLLSLSFPVLADGSYTVMGTVYGNGIVMLNGTTFTGTALNSTEMRCSPLRPVRQTRSRNFW